MQRGSIVVFRNSLVKNVVIGDVFVINCQSDSVYGNSRFEGKR